MPMITLRGQRACPPIAAAVMLVAALGCTRGGRDDARMRWVVDPNPIRAEQIRLFRAKNPAIIVINDPDAGPQRILTQLAGGVPPDVFAIYSPQSASLFARKDVLEDLRPWVRRYDVDMDMFWPQLDGFIYERGDRKRGRILGFPDNCGTYMLFYNRRMFREAGVREPDAAWTWRQFTDAALRLTKRDASGRVVQFGAVLPPPYLLELFVWQMGGSWFSQDGSACTVGTPEAKHAFEWWASLRRTHHVAPSAMEEQSLAPLGGWGGSQNLFKAEKAAMIVTGRWLSIEWRQNKALDWDIAPVPYGRHRVGMLESKIYAIPRSARNKELSFRFLRHLVSEDDEMLVADYGDGMPSVAAYCRTDRFLFNPAYPRERRNHLYLSEMAHARTKQQSSWIQQLEADTIRDEECERIWQKEVTPSQAADSIARRVNTIIRRNRGNPNLMD
jgi:multiple sugar transport system substrate-binding protein